MRGLYKVVRNLISPEEAHEIYECIKKSPKNNGDEQVPKSHSYYNLPVCNILLGQLTNKVSELAGKKLRPTYTYCRVCFKGADLKPHKDRPSCEYSVTLNISQTHPWIIFMGKQGVTQRPGDGVLYRGCEIEHSRPEFIGDEYVQLFLHYVDSEGPYKDYVYDQKRNPRSTVSYSEQIHSRIRQTTTVSSRRYPKQRLTNYERFSTQRNFMMRRLVTRVAWSIHQNVVPKIFGFPRRMSLSKSTKFSTNSSENVTLNITNLS